MNVSLKKLVVMKHWVYLIISIIVLLSFRFYSALFYPALNSDNAVIVLMTHYFEPQNDLYFWGQDRVGSLIPLLGQIPFRVLGVSALTSESIVHYGILLFGYLAFSHFLKSQWLKVIFAVVWFFPPMRLIDITQLPFGIHYSLIAMGCYLFDCYQKERIQKRLLLRHLVLASITLLLICAVWVSDIALVSISLLIGVKLFFFIKKIKFGYSLITRLEVLYGFIGCALGYGFIHYAKSVATVRQEYATLSSIENIKEACITFWNTILDIVTFQANEPFTSVYSYLVIGIVFFTISQLKKLSINETTRKVAVFLLLDALLVFVVILTSEWTFLNGVPRRYFVCTYISSSVLLLLLLDNLAVHDRRRLRISVALLCTTFIGGFGSLYNLKYVWPKTITPRVEIAREFEQLGRIGIIADYWNSYIVSCVNPDQIKATPHDLPWTVKNYKIVDEVFEQENIYLIKDMWLESFPDSLTQFGKLLIKDGSQFRMGECDVCKYRKGTASLRPSVTP